MRTVTARIERLERKHPQQRRGGIVVYTDHSDGSRTYTDLSGDPLSQVEVLELDNPILLPAKAELVIDKRLDV